MAMLLLLLLLVVVAMLGVRSTDAATAATHTTNTTATATAATTASADAATTIATTATAAAKNTADDDEVEAPLPPEDIGDNEDSKGPGYPIWPPSPVPQPFPRNCLCPLVFDPVCSVSRITYANACFAQCSNDPVAVHRPCQCGFGECSVGTQCCNGLCVQPLAEPPNVECIALPSCGPGFLRVGERCVSLCQADPCEHGVCVGENQCECEPGWTGRACNVPLCDAACLNYGRCILPNRCVCPLGFAGDACEISLDCGTCPQPCPAFPPADDSGPGGDTPIPGQPDGCSSCPATDLCCAGRCYNPQTHVCTGNSSSVLCGVGEDSCNGVCFHKAMYACSGSSGRLVFIGNNNNNNNAAAAAAAAHDMHQPQQGEEQEGVQPQQQQDDETSAAMRRVPAPSTASLGFTLAVTILVSIVGIVLA